MLMKSKTRLLPLFALLGGILLASAQPAYAQRTDLRLTLLHSNDGESDLIDAGSGLEDFGGVDRFATLVDKLRADGQEGLLEQLFNNLVEVFGIRLQRRDVVLISSGDNFLAGPEFNVSMNEGVPYLDSIALLLIRYDAMAIGNHEFDFGPDVFADFVDGFYGTTKFVSANLDFSMENGRLQSLVANGAIAPSRVITRHGRKIGIVGATTPMLPLISSPRNVKVGDVLPAVQAQIDALTRSGVKIIILASHLQDADEDLALLAELHGVDIAIAGGGDELLANAGTLLVPDNTPVAGPYPLAAQDADGKLVPVVTTNGGYRYVGRLVAEFDKQGRLLGIDTGKSGPVRVAGGNQPDAVRPDPLIKFLVTDPLREALADLESNIIATTEVGLNGVRADVRTRETNMGNLIADSLLFEARRRAAEFGVPEPDVALQNGGGIRNDSVIGPGDFSELNSFEVLPFANFVSVVPDVPRAQFRQLLERAASGLPGAAGNFAQVAGFRVVYDLSETAQVIDGAGNILTMGERVRELVLDDGTVIVQNGNVVAGADIHVATIDFLARGGDGYPYLGASFTTVGTTYQQAMVNYMTFPTAQGGLGGTVRAADYPQGGEGRITIQ